MRSEEGIETSPSTPRQRGQACERCWKRKQKVRHHSAEIDGSFGSDGTQCDKCIPACTNCIGVGAECIPRKFASGPIANSGNLSHATVPSYVETLKRKRDDLEDQIRRQRARPQHDGQPQPPRNTTHRVQPQDETSNAQHDVADTTVQAAMGEIGLLSRSAMAEPRDEMSGFSQELAMGRMVRATIAISGKDPTKSTMNAHSAITAIVDQATALTREVSLPYITRFVERIEPHFLHLSQSRIWVEFEAYFQETNEEAGTSGNARVISFNIYMNTAIGMLLSPDSASLQGFASSLQAAAMKMFAGILESGSRFNILHCMLSLIVYSMQTSLGGSTWHLLGLAMQKAITFGFHRDPNPEISLPAQQLKERRDIFWGLYTVDRTISIIMDRPFNIEDEDLNVQSPDQDTYNNSEMTDSIACQTVNHARLMSTIRNSSSEGIIFHYSNLCYWKELTSGSDKQSKMSAKCIRQLSCRAMVQTLKSKGSAIIDECMIASSHSIRNDFIHNCQEYIEDEYQRSERGELAGTFVDAYDIFAAGVVVICLTGKRSNRKSVPDVVHKCTVTLTLLVERFPALRVFRRVLWALSSATLEDPFDPILHELPEVIPEGIQNLIKEFIS